MYNGKKNPTFPISCTFLSPPSFFPIQKIPFSFSFSPQHLLSPYSPHNTFSLPTLPTTSFLLRCRLRPTSTSFAADPRISLLDSNPRTSLLVRCRSTPLSRSPPSFAADPRPCLDLRRRSLPIHARLDLQPTSPYLDRRRNKLPPMDNVECYDSPCSDDLHIRSFNGEGSKFSLIDIDEDCYREFDSATNERNQYENDSSSVVAYGTESSTNEPFIGQEFENEEEARRFYNIYAYKMGFSIRKSTHYKSKKKENMITALHYVCSKEGHSKPKSRGAEDKGTPKKLMRYTRTGCKAHLRVKRKTNEKWEVVTFVKEHNHDLVVSPSKTRFLRSHRSITPEQKKIIHMLSEQKISTSQIMSFIASNEGGSQNIYFTRRDLSNEISRGIEGARGSISITKL